MCGICGIVSFKNKPVHIGEIQSMMNSMKFRGPDDEGTMVKNNVGLGFVRLSILDLSSDGHQPMYSKDNNLCIVFNGEIYNYLEIKSLLSSKYQFTSNTDTEVLLAAYQHWGEKCLDHLNGMFAFAIYNFNEESLFIARDRFGIKPFYYYLSDDIFVFASDIPPILKILENEKYADLQSIYDFLLFNRTNHTEHTFFKRIKKLKHSHKIIVNNNKINISRWYNLEENVANPFNDSGEFRELLLNSIELRLRSNVAVGTCLSGGLDSSAITSLVTKDLNKPNMHTFSSVFGEGEKGDESKFINLYDGQIKNMHFIRPSAETLKHDLDNFIEAIVEPVPGTSAYSEFKVMQLAKDYCTVILSGQGADEELGGYIYMIGYHFKELLLSFRIMSLLKEIKGYHKNHKTLEGIYSFIFSLLPSNLRSNKFLLKKQFVSNDFFKDFKVSNEITSKLYGANSLKKLLLNHFEYKLEHHLSWADRSGMWFSMETRFPFLDHRLVERILAQESNNIINNGVTKSILRKAMVGSVPNAIINRMDKVGYETPEDTWLRSNIFKELILDIFSSVSFINRGLYHNKEIIRTYNKHLKGEINAGKEIWKFIHMELWFRKFID
jgi:asparagine synthase (glutamine-hydrolysing)